MTRSFETVFGRKTAFIPFITAGDPDLSLTLEALKVLSDNGADIIELGVPFTDPIADGPTIQKSSERALKNPFHMQDILDLVRNFRAQGYETPILLMTYANPVFVMGYDAFSQAAVAAGVDAALITDLPPEEAEDFVTASDHAGLRRVFLCSPTTTPERLKLVDKYSNAFVYYVARAGVTGVRDDLPADVVGKLTDLKQTLSNPLCVGFGISTPAQAQALSGKAAGIIVGSAIVKLFEDHQGQELLDRLATFTAQMKAEASHA